MPIFLEVSPVREAACTVDTRDGSAEVTLGENRGHPGLTGTFANATEHKLAPIPATGTFKS